MRLSIFAAALLATACANQSQQAAPAPAPAPLAVAAPELPKPEEHRMQAPFVLALEGPRLVEPGAKVEVIAAIERKGWFQAPIDLEVLAGDGIDVLVGKTTERIEDPEDTRIVRRFTVLVRDPTAAFEVRASISGEGFGANAQKRLTFDGAVEAPRPRPRPGAEVQPR
ncbi:MAG TPA: hypothetical protein VGD74_03165 [Vulgatibacter sp.]